MLTKVKGVRKYSANRGRIVKDVVILHTEIKNVQKRITF
jgi:hypothetical protein